jgi:HSP20 family protein
MAMERWDPFREMMTLREAIDRLFQQSVVRPGSILAGMRAEAVPVDIRETENAYVVRASVPGIRPEDLDISVQGDTLTIRGEAKAEEERAGENWVVREHRYGTLQRTLTLPSAVNADRAEAHCEHGVLTLTLPKAEEAKLRRVPIAGGGQAGGGRPSGGSARGSARATATSGDARKGSADETAGGDRVTAESQESFPASDPPSWTPEKA